MLPHCVIGNGEFLSLQIPLTSCNLNNVISKCMCHNEKKNWCIAIVRPPPFALKCPTIQENPGNCSGPGSDSSWVNTLLFPHKRSKGMLKWLHIPAFIPEYVTTLWSSLGIRDDHFHKKGNIVPSCPISISNWYHSDHWRWKLQQWHQETSV